MIGVVNGPVVKDVGDVASIVVLMTFVVSKAGVVGNDVGTGSVDGSAVVVCIVVIVLSVGVITVVLMVSFVVVVSLDVTGGPVVVSEKRLFFLMAIVSHEYLTVLMQKNLDWLCIDKVTLK